MKSWSHETGIHTQFYSTTKPKSLPTSLIALEKLAWKQGKPAEEAGSSQSVHPPVPDNPGAISALKTKIMRSGRVHTGPKEKVCVP